MGLRKRRQERSNQEHRIRRIREEDLVTYTTTQRERYEGPRTTSQPVHRYAHNGTVLRRIRLLQLRPQIHGTTEPKGTFETGIPTEHQPTIQPDTNERSPRS